MRNKLCTETGRQLWSSAHICFSEKNIWLNNTLFSFKEQKIRGHLAWAGNLKINSMQTKFTKRQFTVIFWASKYNTCRQTKPVYPPPPQTKSIEGSEFGQQYNYLYELKQKYKLNNVYIIIATYIFETPFFISNNYFHYKISFVYLG